MKVILENMNLLPHDIGVNYQKKTKFHTIFGLSLSLIFYFIFAYCAFYFSYDFIYKTNPQIVYQQKALNEAYTCNLSNLIHEVQFKGLIKHTSKKANLTKEKRENLKKFIPQTIFLIIAVSKRNLDYSLKENRIFALHDFNYINIEDDGISEDKMFNYVLEFEAIINKTTKFSIQDDSEQLFSLEEITFNPSDTTIAMDFLLSNFSIKQPVFINRYSIVYHYYKNFFNKEDIYYSENYTDFFSTATRKLSYINYALAEITEDRGNIFSNSVVKYYLDVENYFFNDISGSEASFYDSLSQVAIKFGKNMHSHKRIFKKLQNVLADLGGLFSSFIAIGAVIVSELNKRVFDLDVINKLYKLDTGFNIYVDKEEKKNMSGVDKKSEDNFKELVQKNIARDNKVFSSEYLKSKNIRPLHLTGFNNKISSAGDNNNNNIDYKNLEDKSKSAVSARQREDLLKRVKMNELINLVKDKNIAKEDASSSRINMREDYSVLQYSNRVNNSPPKKPEDSNNKFENEIIENESNKSQLSIWKENKTADLRSNPNVNKYNLGKRLKIDNLINKFLLNQQVESKKRTIEFSFYEIIKSIILCDKMKSKDLVAKDLFYNLAENRIYECMDIFTLIKHYEIFEIMKNLLFNENQIKSFDFFKTDYLTKKNDAGTIQNNLVNLFEYFTSNNESRGCIKGSNEAFFERHLDKKILKYMDTSILDIFEM